MWNSRTRVVTNTAEHRESEKTETQKASQKKRIWKKAKWKKNENLVDLTIARAYFPRDRYSVVLTEAADELPD